MSSRPPRRISLLDAMILIAAMALGLSLQRVYTPDLLFALSQEYGQFRLESGLGRATAAVLRALLLSLPWGLTLTVAALGIQFRPPRPRLRRLIRQPGPTACLIAFLAVIVEMGDVGLRYVLMALTTQNSPWQFRLPSPPFIQHMTDPLGMGTPSKPFASYGATLFGAFGHQVAPFIGCAVATAWLILAIGGWHRDRSGVGCLGWLIGLYWITAAALIRLLLESAWFLR